VGRSEVFAVVAGILGFVADIITIVQAVNFKSEHSSDVASPVWPILMAVTTLYVWMIFSWYLTKWRFLKAKRLATSTRIKKPELSETAFSAVLSIGIVIAPLVLYIGYSIATHYYQATDTVDIFVVTIAIAFGTGLSVAGVLIQGMPLIYDDISG
jgi:magnesium-transporting ATPase (P-type)